MRPSDDDGVRVPASGHPIYVNSKKKESGNMHSSISEVSGTAVSNTDISLVRPEFRKGYTIAALPYQTGGILCRLLWPSRDQILRIVPGFNPETGEIFRQNINCGEFSPEADYTNYLSDTFYNATVVTKFGSDYRSPFISDYAPGSADERKYGGDTVIHNFIRSITYAVRRKAEGKRGRLQPIPEWSVWAGLGPQAKLGFDKKSLLMQALVIHLNGRNNQDANKADLIDANGNVMPLYAVVVMDSWTSIGSLCQALVEPMDPSKPLDAITNNKFGGMAELNGNMLYLNTYKEPTKGRASLRPSVQGPGQGWTPKPAPLSEDFVRQVWKPWNQLLHFMTAEEQLRLCAQEFGADTVNYVFGSDPKFYDLHIPEEISSRGLGRYAGMAGYAKSAGYQPASGLAAPASQAVPYSGSQPFLTPQATAVHPVQETGQAPSFPGAAGAGQAGAVCPAAPAVQVAAVQAPASPAAPVGMGSFGLPMPGFSGVPASSGVDVDRLRDSVSAIRAATAGSAGAVAAEQDEQADTASSILGQCFPGLLDEEE